MGGMDLRLARPALDGKGLLTIDDADILGENALSFELRSTPAPGSCRSKACERRRRARDGRAPHVAPRRREVHGLARGIPAVAVRIVEPWSRPDPVLPGPGETRVESTVHLYMLPSGQAQVIGKYRVVREIGRGGVGVVYEAENTWTHRRVALKVLSGSVAADAGARERFLREARTAGRLVHPNVVAMIDADMEKDGSIYIVQELLVGEDLETRIERDGPLELTEAQRLLLPVMDALSAAHAAGIVHRDIKPSNVFLTRAGKTEEPKLIDFGLSKLVGGDVRITTQGMAIGTPAYMSPEQFYEPDTVDHQSDVWAMAVVWFECLTARLPYDGKSPAEIAGRVVSGKRAKLRDVARSMPEAVAVAIERGLVHDRKERWTSMSAMRSALGAALGLPPRPSERPRPPLTESEEVEIEIDASDIDDDIRTEVRGSPHAPSAPARRPTKSRSRHSAPPGPAGKPEPTIPTAQRGLSRALLLHGLRALRFGIVPTAVGFDDPAVAEALSRTVEMPIVVLRFGGYDELFAALREKRVEAAWMSPVAFVRAQAAGLATGALVVLRGGKSSYVSVLLGHEARVKTLDAASLRGRCAAWVDRWSAGGYLVPRRMLRDRKIDANQVLRAQVSAGSYGAVIDCLRAGTADIGGVFGWRDGDGKLWHFGGDHRELKVLAVSDPIPSDVLALHAELPPAIGRSVASGFAKASPDDALTRGLLAAVSADGFTKFEPARYEWVARAVREDEQSADGPRPTERLGAAVDDLDWD